MEFKGIVKTVVDKSGVSKKDNKPYTSWKFIVEEDTQNYPNSMVLDIFGDKVTCPKEGDRVNVIFNTKAKEYNGNLYQNNNVWKIEKEEEEEAMDTSAPAIPIPDGGKIETEDKDEEDILPF